MSAPKFYTIRIQAIVRGMIHEVPWAFSLATAIWFGLMARRADRSWLLWGIGGAFLALASSTIVLGVSEAVFIPLSHEACVHSRIGSVAAAALTVGALGWLVTLSLPCSPQKKDGIKERKSQEQ